MVLRTEATAVRAEHEHRLAKQEARWEDRFQKLEQSHRLHLHKTAKAVSELEAKVDSLAASPSASASQETLPAKEHIRANSATDQSTERQQRGACDIRVRRLLSRPIRRSSSSR